MSMPAPPPPAPAAAEPVTEQQSASPSNSMAEFGAYDGAHGRAKNIMAANFVFEGMRVAFAKPCSNNLQVTHTLELGEKSSYHFAPTYVGTLRRLSEQESFPIVMGDIADDGSMTAQAIHDFSKSLRCKFQAQTSGSKYVGTQTELEYRTGGLNLGTKIVNFNPFAGKVIWLANFLQKVTSKFSCGAEYTLQCSDSQVMGSALAFLGIYRTDAWTAACTASPMGILNATYAHQIDKQTTAATELDIDLRSGDVTGSIGVQYAMSQATARAQITSRGQVVSYFERQIQPGMNLLLSGILDHVSGKAKFGVGLSLGQ